MSLEAVGILVAIAVAIGGVGAQIFWGGRQVQRLDDVKEDVEELKGRVDDHDDELSSGKARFAAVETKIDLMLSQQRQTLDKIDRLAEQKG